MTTSTVDYDQLFAYRIFLQEEEKYENEKDIINLLRLELINKGIPDEAIPNHLKTFYEKFNINFTMDEINGLLNTDYLIDEITNHLQAIAYHIPMQMQIHNHLTVPHDDDDEDEDDGGGDYEEDDGDEGGLVYGDDDDDDYANMPPLIPINTIMGLLTMPPLLPPINQNNLNMNLLNMNQLIPPINNLNQDVVSTLKEEEFNKIKKYSTIKNLNENCCICLVNMNSKEEIWELPCSHKFHGECIETLLKNYNYKCPTCRSEVGIPQHNI
jgi:hypothetical protein